MIIEGVTYPLVHSHTLHLADSSNDLSPSITSSAYIIHRTTSSTTTTAVKQEGGRGKNWTSLEAFSTSNNNYRTSIIPFRVSPFFFLLFFLLSLFSLMVHREKGFCQREFLCVAQYLKGRNEKGGGGEEETEKFLFSWYFYDCRPHPGALFTITRSQDLPKLRTLHSSVVYTLARVLREIRKPRELCASRDTACTSSYVSGGLPVALCLVGGIIEPVANNPPLAGISAPFVSAKHAQSTSHQRQKGRITS